MSSNAPPAPPAATPLQWMVGHDPAARLVALVLAQGALKMEIRLSPEDVEKIGHALIDHASQARSGLIIPAGMPNGGKQS